MNFWALIISAVTCSAHGAISSSENFNGCSVSENTVCPDVFCPDGRLPPVSPHDCCPDPALCFPDYQLEVRAPATPTPATNCSAIGCLVELCPDGSVPPTPPGRCCPSGLLCPRDCQGVTCNIYHCRDGSVAPVSPGLCCPDPLLCLDSLSCAEWECPPAFCPNGDLAPHPPGQCCPDPSLCSMADCDAKAGLNACIPEFCPDGSLAPIARGECCPRSSQCEVTDCAAVRCLVERCSDGSVAPSPPGRCCPSLTQCQGERLEYDVRHDPAGHIESVSNDVTSQETAQCEGKHCLMVHCEDGSVAPVPPGTCCPNKDWCHRQHCQDVACFQSVCPDGSPAPVPPSGCCPDTSQCLVLSYPAMDWLR